MSLWLNRAGRYGEHEPRFFKDNRIYLTWGEELPDLGACTSYEDVKKIVTATYAGEGARRLGNWAGQIWAFSVAMKPDDLVVTPLKHKPSIAVGTVKSGYVYDKTADSDYRHYREVAWLNREVPRDNFDSDLLYSIGSIMTICEIKRNEAEARVRAMAKNGWKGIPLTATVKAAEFVKNADGDGQIDVEPIALDQIRRLVSAKFKGHAMEQLVNEVLRAQGYETFVSPEGADGAKDILAAPGHLGFGSPRICVQVKSTDGKQDRKTLDELMGVMKKYRADQGVLVSWGGFKDTLLKDAEKEFFTVRLWDSKKLLEEVLKVYEKLPEDLRADIPLKRIWTVALDEED